MYILLDGDMVKEIIPDVDEFFKLPVEKRYTKSFIDKCIHVNDDIDVRVNMRYDSEKKEFYDVPDVEVVEGVKSE